MITPKGFRILVRKDPVEKVSSGGIVIVSDDELQEANMNIGRVVAIGDIAYKAYSPDYTGKRWVEVGDHVTWSKHAERRMVDPYTNDKDLYILNDDDIIAVMSSGENPK